MDTARFKYPSYFADSKSLFESMKLIDSVTGLSRGYLIMTNSKDSKSKSMPLVRITANRNELTQLRNLFDKVIIEKLQSGVSNRINVFQAILSSISDQHQFFLNYSQKPHDLAGSREENVRLNLALSDEINRLLEEVKKHKLFEIVSRFSDSECHHELHLSKSQGNQLATLFLLSLPRQLFQCFPMYASKALLDMQESHQFSGLDILFDEVRRLRGNWSDFLNSHCHECDASSLKTSCKKHK
jgi:glutathione gamma-glutamylcysteinyltransferase